MSVRQFKNQGDQKNDMILAPITIEKASRPSPWAWLRRSFSSEDIDIETWKRLEMKRSPVSLRSQQRRLF